MAAASMPRTLARDVTSSRGVVRLCGSVHAVRRLGGLSFIILRDRSGTVQVVRPGETDLGPETVVEVQGSCRSDSRAPGGVEVQAERITVIGRPQGLLPFDVSKPVLRATLDTLLNHRAVSLRHPSIQAIFRAASALVDGFRSHLIAEDFTEIHTSKLVATGTEGGANLFQVDYGDRTAFLAQSPQLYKQICVGAFERVFEIGPAYRNEPHETTRHLNEYTSLDVELAFTDLEGLLDLETALLRSMLARVPETSQVRDGLGLAPPAVDAIPRLRLSEAKGRLARHGTTYPAEADLDPAGERLLGKLLRAEGSEFVFITHYPAAVRPFYAMPDPEDPALTLSFDLLFRGLEVTTGGIRIHDDARLRENMIRRGLPADDFRGYLEAFACGMPPHGGFAIGLERFTAQLVGVANVREATLFPRDRRRIGP